MPRPKKEKPNHGSLYEVKITIGRTLEGKLIRKSFYSAISKADAKRQAEAWRVEQQVAERTGDLFLAREDMTFADWAGRWLTTYKQPNVRPNTYLNSYLTPTRNHLIPYFGKAKLMDIRPADIQLFYKEVCSNFSHSQVHKLTLCLNGIFESAINNDLLLRSPMRGVIIPSGRLPDEKRTYTREQADAIKAFAAGHPYGLDIILLLELGLRRGELLGLRWEDVDLQQRTITIRRSVYLDHNQVCVGTPKTRTSIRVLPISEQLAGYLTVKAAAGYLLPNRKGEPFSPDNWDARRYRVFMDDLQAAAPELPALNPHELRHTCGTLLYQQTHDIFAVSKFLGHADIAITSKIYVHEDVEGLRNSLGF